VLCVDSEVNNEQSMSMAGHVAALCRSCFLEKSYQS